MHNSSSDYEEKTPSFLEFLHVSVCNATQKQTDYTEQVIGFSSGYATITWYVACMVNLCVYIIIYLLLCLRSSNWKVFMEIWGAFSTLIFFNLGQDRERKKQLLAQLLYIYTYDSLLRIVRMLCPRVGSI